MAGFRLPPFKCPCCGHSLIIDRIKWKNLDPGEIEVFELPADSELLTKCFVSKDRSECIGHSFDPGQREYTHDEICEMLEGMND